MSKHNQSLELVDRENSKNSKIVESNPKIKLLIKWIGRISLSLAVILLLACFVLLLQDYLLDRVFFEELLIQRLNLSFGRPEIRYLSFKAIGYSLLIIAIVLRYIMDRSLNKIRFILLIIALFNLFYALNIFCNFSPDVFHWNKYFFPNNVLTIVVHFTCIFAVFTNVLFDYRERDRDKLMNICGYLMFLTVAMTT